MTDSPDVAQLYSQGVPPEYIVTTIGGDYSVEQLRLDLWEVFRKTGTALRGTSYTEPLEDGLHFDPLVAWEMALVKAYDDLMRGKPCTIAIPTKGNDRCMTCKPKEEKDHPCAERCLYDNESHTCAPDAYAWFTSMEFFDICEITGWAWQRHVKAAVGIAAQNRKRYPFIPLEEAMAWRVASDLESAGRNIRERAATLARLRKKGAKWRAILRSATMIPSGEAMEMANEVMGAAQ